MPLLLVAKRLEKMLSFMFKIMVQLIEDRLTGAHETQKFDTFSYGVSDRGRFHQNPLAS